MLQSVREAVAWRWRKAMRIRYLRKNFQNGEVLATSYLNRIACDLAIASDGTVIRHPPGRTGLAGMILEVWFDQVYTGRFYTPAQGDVVVDAGANVGLFSLLVAQVQPDCRVLAFEPFEENFQLLRDNLRSAKATGVCPFLAALTGQSGEMAMLEKGERSQDHQLTDRHDVRAVGPAIRTYSMNDILLQADVDFITMFKCDIEGSEYDLFAAATPESLSRLQRCAIEYHDNIRPGVLELLRDRLSPTHAIDVKPAGGGYGMVYAVAKSQLTK